MNLVDLKILDVRQPEVFFNDKEIEYYLDGLLTKYEGLVFTEEMAKECKATVAELNKMVKSVDAFRLKYKKELSEPIVEFENKCKSLISQIDSVQGPLKAQTDNFEIKRRAQRRVEIDGFVDEVLLIVPLEEKWSSQLNVKDEWLNSSLSNSKAKQAIFADAQKLAADQKSYYDKMEVIITKCELYSMKFGLSVPLIPDNFYYLLDNYEGPEIDSKIYGIAEKTKERETEAIEKIRAEAEKKAAKQAEVEIEKVKADAQTQVDEIVQAAAQAIEQVQEFIPVESDVMEKLLTVTLRITGTKGQLEVLKSYMTTYNIEFEKLQGGSHV